MLTLPRLFIRVFLSFYGYLDHSSLLFPSPISLPLSIQNAPLYFSDPLGATDFWCLERILRSKFLLHHYNLVQTLTPKRGLLELILTGYLTTCSCGSQNPWIFDNQLSFNCSRPTQWPSFFTTLIQIRKRHVCVLVYPCNFCHIMLTCGLHAAVSWG